MSTAALCLNADYQPLKVVPWKEAVLMVLDGRAELVTGYVDRLVRSASTSMPWPAVIRLQKYVQQAKRLRFNRQNVLARDGYTCAYCGCQPVTKRGKPDLSELTLDHVIPRAQSKNGRVRTSEGSFLSVTCWENVVTACVPCNMKKADRTPGQAGMKLHLKPRTPSSMDVVRMMLTKVEIPAEWEDYLPADSGWRGYWTAELES